MPLPSKAAYTGFQYEPVLSITTCVQPVSCSHCLSLPNSALYVPNRRNSAFGSSSALPHNAHTLSSFCATSMPAHRSTTAFIALLLSVDGPVFLCEMFFRGPEGSNRGFLLLRPGQFRF